MVSLQKGQVRTAPSSSSVIGYSFFRPQTGHEKGSLLSIGTSPLGPDSWDRLSTIPALPILQVDLSNHISCPLDNHLLAFWTKGIFPCVARDVPDINIFKTCG